MTPKARRAPETKRAKPGMIVLNGRLPGTRALGWSGSRLKQLAAVVQHEAQVARCHARTHAAEVGLDQRHHQAVAVGCGEVHGLRRIKPRVAVQDLRRGARRIDQLAALERVLLGNQLVHRRRREGGIGVEARPVLERQLLGLGEQVQVPGRAEAGGGEVVLLQEVENLQRGDPLGVGGQGVDVVAAIARRHRPDPFGAVRGQVGFVQVAAVLAHVVGDLPGDLAPVERFPASLRQQFVGCGQARVAEDPALAGRFAVWHERVGESRVVGQGARIGGPGGGRQLRDRKSFMGKRDGRRKKLGEVLAAVALVQFVPAVHRARNGYRQRPERGDVLQSALAKDVEIQRAWRPAAGVQAGWRVLAGFPDHGEQVAADAAAGGLGKPQHGVGGDRRVDSVAAGAEQVQAGLGGEHLAGRHHAPGAQGLGTRGERRPGPAFVDGSHSASASSFMASAS